MNGGICGGIINESYLKAYWKKHGDPYGLMLATYLPDKQFKKYETLMKKQKTKQAGKILEKYGRCLAG